MMRKKTLEKTILILLLIFTTIAISLMLAAQVKGEEYSFEDYKTKYNYLNQVYIEERQEYNRLFIYDDFDGCKFLFNAEITLKAVTPNSSVHIRKLPCVESESLGILRSDKYMIEVARSYTGWSVVVIDGKWAFIWSEYIDHVELEEVDELITNSENLSSWEYLGNCRISSYCYKCNTPKYSRKSSISGWSCEEWTTCAINGVPLGTHVYVEGFGEFVVNDRGPAAMNGACWVDLFVDTEDCHIWCKRDVYILK